MPEKQSLKQSCFSQKFILQAAPLVERRAACDESCHMQQTQHDSFAFGLVRGILCTSAVLLQPRAAGKHGAGDEMW